jgi:hypothetical protein
MAGCECLRAGELDLVIQADAPRGAVEGIDAAVGVDDPPLGELLLQTGHDRPFELEVVVVPEPVALPVHPAGRSSGKLPSSMYGKAG